MSSARSFLTARESEWAHGRWKALLQELTSMSASLLGEIRRPGGAASARGSAPSVSRALRTKRISRRERRRSLRLFRGGRREQAVLHRIVSAEAGDVNGAASETACLSAAPRGRGT